MELISLSSSSSSAPPSATIRFLTSVVASFNLGAATTRDYCKSSPSSRGLIHATRMSSRVPQNSAGPRGADLRKA